jgi:xylulose-5-phosphate/fructose-6-phosphate phosphoketolase
MAVLNEMDRFHLVDDVIDRVPGLGARAAYAKQAIRDKLIDHSRYIREFGQDLPEIREWAWSSRSRTSDRDTVSTEADHG